MRWEMRTVVMKKVKKRKFWMKWKKQKKIKKVTWNVLKKEWVNVMMKNH